MIRGCRRRRFGPHRDDGPLKVSPHLPLVMQTDFPNVSVPARARMIELYRRHKFLRIAL